MLRTAGVFVLSSWAAACSTSVTCDCVGESRAEVLSESGAFLIRNLSGDREMTATVVVKGSLALIDGVCERWEPRIPPDGTLRVGHDQVVGFFAGAGTVVVHWCTLDGDTVLERGSVEAPFS